MLAVADFFAENLRHQPERADCNTGGCRVLSTNGGRGDCGDPGRHPSRNGHGGAYMSALPFRLLGGASGVASETLPVFTEFGHRRLPDACDVPKQRTLVVSGVFAFVGPFRQQIASADDRNEYVGRPKLPAHARAESTPLARRRAR